ncbi:oxygenase MpaB family protein [Nocardioides pelophilus]|uniref:oxygenase MpaB family protein n=1 Tax=Nocardioides pelophilus TaxID=2172019 RepID=UPI0015FF4F58|nr:oxygenase MpaB family protein [Nocardioides pelophilus]
MKRADVLPHEDFGFFGPDSVTWKVWSYPTSLTIGFQRAVVVEELDPALVASVTETHAIFDRPRTRYDRTLRYFALVAFGSSRETSKAADVLVKIHSKGIGTCPVTGVRYDANDPDSQLWIQLTGWHSILLAYERYGPGRLSPDEEAQYWAECAVAAELQTCDPADIPRNREELRAYYERMRPQLLSSDLAKQAMHQLLDARVMLPKLPWFLTPVSWVTAVALRKGTIATLPRWMREETGLKQSRLMDALIRPVLRVAFGVVSLSGQVQVALLRLISPMTVSVAAPILLGVPPERAEVLTPAQARERYGYDRPRDAHLELRARQHAKVFGEGARPSDEGIIESQPILGRI